jgi:heme/copper-type cytochrome/quinol oxidase subunit 2
VNAQARPGATLLWGVGVAAVLALAGCDQAAPPTTVVVNTPPADGGLAVLLTVVVVLGVLAVVLAAAMACAWSHERRSRRDAEDLVQAVTGRPVGHVRAALATHPTTTSAPVAPGPAQIRLTPPPAAVERWHE